MEEGEEDSSNHGERARNYCNSSLRKYAMCVHGGSNPTRGSGIPHLHVEFHLWNGLRVDFHP